jgi:uncharacterized repeat protein (TIGR03806 family)
MKLFLFLSVLGMWVLVALVPSGSLSRKEKLSEYGFFKGTISQLDPAQGVLPYEVNSELFSNYTEKKRFIRFPGGTPGVYSDSNAFELPVGTVLIKNFYYPEDMRNPDGPRQLIETRLLVHQPKGWEAWPYVWNDNQTEAVYDPAGEVLNMTFIGPNGKNRMLTHAIPNSNQCKSCHARGGVTKPIGISARQLNRNIVVDGLTVNQLTYWQDHNLLVGAPALEKIPSLATWDDPASGTLDQRARSYLDSNCAHCHSSKGLASTSGLFLDMFQTDPTRLGIMKTPVAAGRGAGDLSYDIVPGKPDQSIVIFRMKTIEPGIAMPETGREQIHEEGVALIEEWIRKMDR